VIFLTHGNGGTSKSKMHCHAGNYVSNYPGFIFSWIPAFAGMTVEDAGMIVENAGMTVENAGMTVPQCCHSRVGGNLGLYIQINV
jgi:hypothetical protein